MLDTKKAHEFDIVELQSDLPQQGLKKGDRGVIIELLGDAEAYDLEFIDESTGDSKLVYGIKPTQVSLIGNDEEDRNLELDSDYSTGTLSK